MTEQWVNGTARLCLHHGQRAERTLYIGVTANIIARIDQHRRGVGSNFCRQYGCKTLVHVEVLDRIDDAIAREKALKRWKRQWKLRLIGKHNPDWRDLWDEIARP